VFSLTRIDSDGELQDQWYYPLAQFNIDFQFGLSKLSDGGFVIVGRSVLRDPTTYLPLIIRTNSRGEELWHTRLEAYIEDLEIRPLKDVTSAIVLSDDRIAMCGQMQNPDPNLGMDGLFFLFESARLGPAYVYKYPTDTTVSVLLNESVEFVARARNLQGTEINYQWSYENQILGDDTTETITFDSLGVWQVACNISDADASIEIRWHVTVTDLDISAYTPDTLNLALRRGSSVDFSLDTIRYTDGAEPEILWTKTNLANGQADDAGTESRATIDFPWSGEYSVEGRVSRGESSDAVTWHVDVCGAIWAYVPVGDSLEVIPDSVVHFEVVPSAPEDESLEVRWSVDGGLVREGEFALDWAFSIVDNCQRYLVQCVVTDSVEADTIRWVVTVQPLSTPR